VCVAVGVAVCVAVCDAVCFVVCVAVCVAVVGMSIQIPDIECRASSTFVLQWVLQCVLQ